MEAKFPVSTTQGLLKHFHPEYALVIKLMKEIREANLDPNDPTSHRQILSNGLSVGEFCLWYIASNRTLCTGEVGKKPKAVVKKQVRRR